MNLWLELWKVVYIKVIIIDDNYSNVNLRNKIIHQFGYTNHRIKLILSNEDLGATNARNIGIKNSRGKYISFLDDDDEYMPDRILKLMACFKKSRMKNLALVYSYGIIIYPIGNILIYWVSTREYWLQRNIIL